MPDQETMSIAEVMSQINAATDVTRPFLLRFVRSSGQKIGSIKTLPAAIKGFPQGTHGASQGKREGKATYREHSIVPVVDLSTGRLNTVLISHIIQYNNFKVIH